jgi:hypothetical protein
LGINKSLLIFRGYSTGSISHITYRVRKNKSLHVYLPLHAFYDLSVFTALMLDSQVSLDNLYTVYVKIRYNKDNFFMAGNQFGFKYNSVNDLHILFNDIKVRLDDYFGYYNLSDDEIIYVQVSFRALDRMVYSDLLLDKNKLTNLSPSTVRTTLDIISIPTTRDENDLGKPLPVVIDYNNNNKIKEIKITINGVSYNFLDIMRDKTKYIRANHKDNITDLDMSYKFYYIKSSIDYILGIKELGDNKVEKLKYSLSGVLLNRIIDVTNGDKLIRSRGLETIYIENNNVVKTSNLISLKSIKPYKVKDKS